MLFPSALSNFYFGGFYPSSQPLSPSESDPTDPALSLSVLLSADLTVEEMFCLILKCEEICGRSAKSHYSPPCFGCVTNPRRRGKNGTETQKENVQTLPDRRVTEIPNAVIVIKVNWLQLAG